MTSAPATCDGWYATTPANLNFTQVTNSVFSTGDIIGYPGNSGGPLCVQDTNGNYYPAGVYLGGTENSIVRVIDGDVANLINDANVTGNTGATHSAGHPPRHPWPGQCPAIREFVDITIAPPAAYSAGGAWKLAGQTTYSTANPSTLAVTSTNSLQLNFANISGWNPPSTNQPVTVSAGAKVALTCSYTLAVSWPTPAPIVYGTVLGSNQLNAAVSITAGTFIYSPPAGTVLSPGANTPLGDLYPEQYRAIRRRQHHNVNLVVLPAPPVILTAKKSGNSFTFTWSAFTNQTYQIQSTTNLAQSNWTNLGGLITPTNTTRPTP